MQPAKPKRLIIEGQEMQTSPPEGVTILTDENNPLKWEILIAGPKGTPYEGGTFRLSCVFPENYPFKAPSIKFDSKIYHPNVNKDTGEICQDIYEKDWVPTKKVSGVVQLIISMMIVPNVDSPIEASIAEEYRNNKAQYNKNAQEWTQKYAN
jgi:ubiquitin-conjugating enzyme E2 D/E